MNKESMIFRLKLDISTLANEMIGTIPDACFKSNTTTFIDPSMAGGQFIDAVVNRLRLAGHSDSDIKGRVFGVEKSQLRINYAVNKHKLIGTFIVDNNDVPDILKGVMKFDAVVGNFPYQKKVGPKKTEPIWQLFVEQSIKSLHPGGYLCCVHPSGYRNVDGRFKNVGNLLMSLDMKYLEIHDERDGMKTFGAETRYDWYVAQNVKSTGNTTVKFQDGEVKILNLSEHKFIPNGSYDAVMSLIAKENEPVCEILSSQSMYETRLETMSEDKTDKFKYPVVYTVPSGGVPRLFYSSVNRGHFGVPKLIWSNGRITSIGTIVDSIGEYGMTQFAYGLIDSVKNLPSIKLAFDNPKFREIMTNCSPGDLALNRKVIALFRKDFWKEFI